MKLAGLAALLIAAGIGLGAFGAHGLEERVTPERLDVWNTASQYHLINALGLLLLGLRFGEEPKLPNGAVAFLVGGLFVFSGSLYALVLLDLGILGAITPIGGLALITGWSWLGIHLMKGKKHAA